MGYREELLNDINPVEPIKKVSAAIDKWNLMRDTKVTPVLKEVKFKIRIARRLKRKVFS